MFLGVEEAFRTLKGVKETSVGYAGGDMENPTYEDVCTDKTGHVEVVKVTFDPKIITYDKLLATFWKVHDPTQVNRQGPDVGTQYRSVIFFFGTKQKEAAEKSLEKEQKRHAKKIATKIQKAPPFYRAEEYHQRYLSKRGANVCH